jgi:hypothetical protein
MEKNMSSGQWIPEIMYEEAEENGASSHIPFIMVPLNESMPNILYIFESRDIGQTEPNMDGDEVPVYEWDLHQYADMLKLKNGLDKKTYDKVRTCLGLEPLNDAIEKGKKITSEVRNNLK